MGMLARVGAGLPAKGFLPPPKSFAA